MRVCFPTQQNVVNFDICQSEQYILGITLIFIFLILVLFSHFNLCPIFFFFNYFGIKCKDWMQLTFFPGDIPVIATELLSDKLSFPTILKCHLYIRESNS